MSCHNCGLVDVVPLQTFGLKRKPTFKSPMIRLYASLCVLIQVCHPMKPNHPKFYMDMHNILSTHDVIQIYVKSEHATCNASIAKMFKNMPYLEGGTL
jgi:hypothetical protein